MLVSAIRRFMASDHKPILRNRTLRADTDSCFHPFACWPQTQEAVAIDLENAGRFVAQQRAIPDVQDHPIRRDWRFRIHPRSANVLERVSRHGAEILYGDVICRPLTLARAGRQIPNRRDHPSESYRLIPTLLTRLLSVYVTWLPKSQRAQNQEFDVPHLKLPCRVDCRGCQKSSVRAGCLDQSLKTNRSPNWTAS